MAADDSAFYARVLRIAESLHGLSLDDAESTLNKVRELVSHTNFVDVTTPAFKDQIEGYNQTFGTDEKAPVKQ